ncbi:RING finger protein 11 [Phytophthora boehmeriae]|uniref:RING finger protein 11 n=1 Tax=Phytophthora boehmeriae TaxID=109152 RepID=A0A8T1W5Y5_9STRA|nr:RING finger protein 11 [Phytophthora boehmeriae]
MASDQDFPESLAWVERGSVLIRRMNSERVAEDPRVRRLLLKLSLPPSPTEVTEMEAIAEEEKGAAAAAEDAEEKLPPPPDSLLLDAQESFEAIEAATDAHDVKQESENAASNAYKVLLWTYRLQASLQSAVQYALFAKTSEDGCFIQIAPRVYCVAPPHITTFSRLFGAYSSARNWNAAVKVLEQLDAQMSKRFEDGACVFDCGLFDGVKRMHHKPLAFDEFCDGRIASISYCRGVTPSMHSGFVVTSTVAAWLDLNPSNVAVLLAPNNEQMSVFATCCTLYCTDASSFPENFGNELLSAYLQHIKLSESWPIKLQRTFSGNDPKNAVYTGGLPRPQSRYIADFCKLLEMRDRKLVACADSPALEERKLKLTGIAVTPANRPIYIRQIDLLSSPDCASDSGASKDISLSPLADIFREKVILMGATEESMDENAPSSFEMGTGLGMSFDEEYARWLQNLYDTELDTPGNNYDDEFVRGMQLTDVQPSLDYRIVSVETEDANTIAPPPPTDQNGRRPHTSKSRGASTSLIHQLPTYIFSAAKDHDDRGTPDCLICRCCFEVGEEIKSLPCFHSYHSDCVDSWLSLNKVCPVCQFSIDQMT